MKVRDKLGAASGTVMSTPNHGKIEFDQNGIAHSATEPQARFLLSAFPDQYEEHKESEEGSGKTLTGAVAIELRTFDGRTLGRYPVDVKDGLGILVANEPPKVPTSMGTVAKEEHLTALVEQTRTELAEALQENARLANESNQLRARLSQASQPTTEPAGGEKKTDQPAGTKGAPNKK